MLIAPRDSFSGAPRAGRERLSRAAGRLWLALGLLLACALHAEVSPVREDRPPVGSQRSLTVPQIKIAPAIDGKLEDSAWAAAAVADRFWISLQQRPPTEQSEVLVMADAENLYFGFRVYDRRPDAIEALQTRRDVGLGLDDRVTVLLDPFLSFSEESTSSFSVSARGTQHDEIGSGRARQLEWKGDWRAASARTAYGWSAEIAIPFAILNFDAGSDRFAANFLRYHNRTRELSQWADTTPRNLSEEVGRLTELRLPVSGKKRPWTFLPYVFAGRNVTDARGEVQRSQGNGGIDIRYEPRANLTGVASLKPDFSQIEEAITDINFSYNEKPASDFRPFFQEGSTYFGGNKSYYFYSPRIPNFDYGAKAFGRFGATQFGSFVSRTPDGRSDLMAHLGHQIDGTHNLSGIVVGSDRGEFQNTLYALRGKGRHASGFNYGFDAAATQTRGADGDGIFQKGELGWKENHWSVGLTLDRYSQDFLPANGIVDRDLLDTRGGLASAGYYRDFAAGPIFNVQGTLYWQQRYTGEDDLQKRYYGASGSVELRRELRFTLNYTAGQYRPVDDTPGTWKPLLNDDHYWSGGVDFNTRSSRLTYGIAVADGFLGGGDYRYVSAYAKSRPTARTYLDVAAERLTSFGTFDQRVITAGWDITPRQNISARYIDAYYGNLLRVAWSWRMRQNADLFAVYDSLRGTPHSFSVKIVFTL